MKTKEELNALKEELEALSRKLRELTGDELAQVIGGQNDSNTFVSGPEADRPKDCPYCHGFLERLYPLYICPRCDYTYCCTD